MDISSDAKPVSEDNYNKKHDDDNSNKKVEQESDGLKQLISMGFSEIQSKQMLEITNGDIQNAIALLTSQVTCAKYRPNRRTVYAQGFYADIYM